MYEPSAGRTQQGRLVLQLLCDFRVCLFVGAVWGGLGMSQQRTAGTVELTGLFASSLQKDVKWCQYDRQSTVEAQERQEKGAANYEPDEVKNCKVHVLYSTSKLHDPVDSQRQQECISR